MRQSLPLTKKSPLHCAAAALSLAIALAGCGNRQPAGQTAATVDGTPITETAVNLEVTASQNRMTRDQALSFLIDRALIVEQAKKQKLDQRPDYTLELARMSDLLLAKQYATVLTQSAGSSLTQTDINAYLAQHPEVGSNRRQITLQQVAFANPQAPQLRADLQAAKTYPAIVDVLRAHQVRFQEGSTVVDTAFAPDALLKAIANSQSGEPFIVMGQGKAVASVLAKEEPVNMSNEDQMALARAKMQQATVEARLGELLKSLRKSVKIEYSDKYKQPPAAKPNA